MIKWKKTNFDWEYELDKFKGDVNAQWNFFSSTLRDAQETCVPHKTISEKARQYPVPLDKKNTGED